MRGNELIEDRVVFGFLFAEFPVFGLQDGSTSDDTLVVVNEFILELLAMPFDERQTLADHLEYLGVSDVLLHDVSPHHFKAGVHFHRPDIAQLLLAETRLSSPHVPDPAQEVKELRVQEAIGKVVLEIVSVGLADEAIGKEDLGDLKNLGLEEGLVLWLGAVLEELVLLEHLGDDDDDAVVVGDAEVEGRLDVEQKGLEILLDGALGGLLAPLHEFALVLLSLVQQRLHYYYKLAKSVQ